jgi:hypothetical protein
MIWGPATPAIGSDRNPRSGTAACAIRGREGKKSGHNIIEMFGWGRKAAVERRAKQIARMVLLVIDGLQTKTYEQFAASFSNPGKVPSTLERENSELSFQMRFSSACWYDAVAVYPRGPDETDEPHFYMQGGGDDWGVFISGNTNRDNRVTVELHVPPGQKAGGDASAMVRALQKMPGWSGYTERET